MNKALFVYNPHTGGNKLKNDFLEIVQIFYDGGYQLTLHPTQKMGDAYRWAHRHSKAYHLLVCCGGDGTLNEVIGGLIQRKSPTLLGYIPGGTTNDFASSLGIPKNNMLEAAKRIVKPNALLHCDIGLFDKRSFNYVAAFGAFTDVSYTTNQHFKNAVGHLAYVFEGLGRLTHLPTITATVECDGEALEGEFLFGMVTNTTSLGGLHFRIEDTIKFDDGLFELLLVRKPKNLADLGGLPQILVKQEFLPSSLIEIRQGKSFVIRSKDPIRWTLDGESGGEFCESHLSVLPRAISIFV